MKVFPILSISNLKHILYYFKALQDNIDSEYIAIIKQLLDEGLFNEYKEIKEIIELLLNNNQLYIEKINQNNIDLNTFKPEISLDNLKELLKIKLKLHKYYKYSNILNNKIENIDSLDSLNTLLNEFYNNVFIDSNYNMNNTEILLRSDSDNSSLKYFESTSDLNIISSGFRSLDVCLNGGFYPVRTYIIAGPAGSGKSSFLRALTLNFINQNKKVFFATLEMTALECLSCFISTKTRIPVEDVINAVKRKDSVLYDKIQQSLKYFDNKLFIKEYLDSHNVFDLVRDFKKLQLHYDFNPDVIVIDYADYYAPAGDWAYFGVIYDTLKSISRQFNVPIITASQTNRESYNVGGETQLSHISNSIEKLKKAECVILIRDSIQEHKKNELRLYVGKNRFGRSKVEISYTFNRNIFEFIEKGFIS